MSRRGRCHCGKILIFQRGPEGYKEICPACGAVVRLKVDASQKKAPRPARRSEDRSRTEPLPIPEAPSPYPENREFPWLAPLSDPERPLQPPTDPYTGPIHLAPGMEQAGREDSEEINVDLLSPSANPGSSDPVHTDPQTRLPWGTIGLMVALAAGLVALLTWFTLTGTHTTETP